VVSALAHSQRLNFQHYGSFEGVPQTQVLTLAQDGDGFLWFGTYGGLSRYNGRRFSTWTSAEGLPSNAVLDIVPASGGGLWVATYGGGICRIDHGSTFETYQKTDRLISNYVRDLEPAGNGSLWIGTDEGITLLGEKESVHYSTHEGLPEGTVWKVFRREDGTILAGTARGIYRLEGQRFEPFAVLNGPNSGVRSLAEIGGRLLAGTERGLFEVVHGRFSPIPLGTGRNEPLVYRVRSDAHGILWVATIAGVFRVEDGHVVALGERNGIPECPVYDVLLNDEGILWFGTDDGLYKLVPGPFVAFRAEDGLPSAGVRAMVIDSGGDLWLGTRMGLAVLRRGRVVRIRKQGFSGLRIYSLAALSGGRMLVGTRLGLYLLEKGRVGAVWKRRDGLPSDHILCLRADPESGTVWVGTSTGIVLWEKGRIVPPHDPALVRARSFAMAWDGRGRLWIGLLSGGVLISDGNSIVRTLGASEGLSDQTVWSLSPDGDRGMWVGTNGDGAFHVVDDSVDRWDAARGLVNDFVWQVLRSSAGDVWFFTSRGLDRLREGRIRHYGRGDGLIALEGMAGAALEDARGHLWFASVLGLIRYDPLEDCTIPSPPRVVLDGASSSVRGAVEAGQRLSYPPGTVAFELATPSFRDEAGIVFRHRLLPVEQEWSDPEPSGTVRFASIAPGSYQFQAIAEGGEGLASAQPVDFSFSVAPPWWRSPLAELIDCVVLIGIIIAVFRMRTRRLERERARLEGVVEERTRTLQQHAEELQRLATTDELTGTANRRKFTEVLEGELHHLSRAPSSARLSLIVLDLDGFKEVNDSCGHDVGDRLLGAIASRLKASVRVTDLVARYGGDEFAIILPMTTRAGAMRAASKLVKVVSETKVSHGEREISVTVSAGVAVVAPSANVAGKLDALISQADVALYSAKHAGGNRVFLMDGTWH